MVIAVAVVSLTGLLQVLPTVSPGFNLFERLEWITYDWRVRLAFDATAPVAPNLGAVFIDDDSLTAVNREHQVNWPWPRQLHGRVIRELKAQGAKAVGFDIRFGELHPSNPATAVEMPGEGRLESDEYFARQLRETGNVVLAAMGETTNRTWHALMPADLFRTNAAATAHIVSDADSDGVLRRARAFRDDPVHGRIWQLAIVLAARDLGLDLAHATVEPGRIVLRGPGGVERVIPADQDGFFYIDWSLAWNDGRIATESFSDLLQQARQRAAGGTITNETVWRDKLVVIGSIVSGNNVSDIGTTPLAKDTYLLSKQWNVANSVLTGRFVRRAPVSMALGLILLLAGVSAFVTQQTRVLRASGWIVGLAAVYVALAAFVYTTQRYWLPVVMPVGALVLTHVCLVTYRVIFEQNERRRVRAVFAKIVAPEVVDELLRAPHLSLGGENRPVTICFADIRGFTELTNTRHLEALEQVRTRQLTGPAAAACMNAQAGDVLGTVNLYLSIVADQVKQHGGTLDKYIGDSVMAFWGAPVPNERHAVSTVKAAIEAHRAIQALNLERAAENRRREQENRTDSQPKLPMLSLLTLGTGINTGMATVGLMGSETHILNYTVFGREVNLASRLEGVAERDQIIIGETTYQDLLRDDPALAATCRELPPTLVQGIQEPVKIFEVPWANATLETTVIRPSSQPPPSA